MSEIEKIEMLLSDVLERVMQLMDLLKQECVCARLTGHQLRTRLMLTATKLSEVGLARVEGVLHELIKQEV
jgi:hypothetical protein